MGKKCLIIFLSYLFMVTNLLYSQVGVNTETPHPKTALEITTLPTDKSKGIMIPRVTEKERDGILTGMDATAKATVNSIMVFNTDEDCYNFWNVEEDEWKSVCGAMGKAEFDPVICSDITAIGNYVEGTNVDGSNYLSINVNVTKIGSYSISGTTGNGYSFFVTSVVLEKGMQQILIPAQGKPIAAGVDNLAITGIDLVSGCIPTITVASAIAEYSMNCSSAVTNGRYLKGTALTSANTITMNVTVSKPGSYVINTPKTNGITFTGTGDFTSAGTFPVTLVGMGIPTVNLDFDIEIHANTLQGNDKCSVTVPLTLPAMTYAIIGTNIWSWNTGARLSAFNSQSFGPNGIVKMVSFNQLWSVSDVNIAAANLNGTGTNSRPDIVLYFAFDATPNAALSTALASYINKGGCVIYGAASFSLGNPAQYRAVDILMKGIFGVGPNTGSSGTDLGGWCQNQITRDSGTSPENSQDDNCYQINSNPNDPVINGPFGNLAGLWWGEDNESTGTVLVSQLPPNSVQICPGYNQFSKKTVSPVTSTVWYNDNKNFVYFGDCTGAATSNISPLEYPTIYGTGGVPQSKRYGFYPNESSQAQYVYNAALELNALSFLIKKAAVSGINPY